MCTVASWQKRVFPCEQEESRWLEWMGEENSGRRAGKADKAQPRRAYGPHPEDLCLYLKNNQEALKSFTTGQ